MSEELRECPFCGGNAKIETAFYDCDHFWVQCENCKSGTWSHEDSPDEAIAAWNQRRSAPDEPVAIPVEAIEETLAHAEHCFDLTPDPEEFEVVRQWLDELKGGQGE